MTLKRSTTYGDFIADTERLRLLAQERFILEATEQIAKIMEEEHVSKAELASRLNKSKAFVTQLLGGGRNMTIRTLADVMTALGYSPSIQATPLKDGRERRHSVGR